MRRLGWAIIGFVLGCALLIAIHARAQTVRFVARPSTAISPKGIGKGKWGCPAGYDLYRDTLEREQGQFNHVKDHAYVKEKVNVFSDKAPPPLLKGWRWVCLPVGGK